MSPGSPIQCPTCARAYRWNADLAGQKVKCKCGTVMRFPASADGEVQLVRIDPASPPKPAARSTPAKTPPTAPPPPVAGQCPSCGSAIKPTAAICIHCGYDLKAGRQLTTALGVAAIPAAPPTKPGRSFAPRAADASAPQYAKDGWLAPETSINKVGGSLAIIPPIIAATSIWQWGVPLPYLMVFVAVCGIAGGIMNVLNRGPVWAGAVVGLVLSVGGFGAAVAWINYRDGEVWWYQTTIAFILGAMPGFLLQFILTRLVRKFRQRGTSGEDAAAPIEAAPEAPPRTPDTTAMLVVRIVGFTCNGVMLLLGLNSVLRNDYCGITTFFFAGLYNIYALSKGQLEGTANRVMAILANVLATLLALIAMVLGVIMLTGAFALPAEIEQQIPVPPALIGVIGLIALAVGAIIIGACVCTLVYVLMRGKRAQV